MSAAARADRKNLGGALSCRIEASVDCEDEHSPSTLRHSEETSVENPVGPPIAEFAQTTDECPKIPAGMTGQESRYVFEQDGGRSVSLHKVEEGKGEPGSGTGEPSSLSCDAEVLARKTAGPEGDVVPISAISPRLDPPSPARSAGL
jgi:hypothetical protein